MPINWYIYLQRSSFWSPGVWQLWQWNMAEVTSWNNITKSSGVSFLFSGPLILKEASCRNAVIFVCVLTKLAWRSEKQNSEPLQSSYLCQCSDQKDNPVSMNPHRDSAVVSTEPQTASSDWILRLHPQATSELLSPPSLHSSVHPAISLLSLPP